MKVYLTVEGLERVALGRALYSWDYVVRDDPDEPPKHGIQVGVFDPVMPPPAECVVPVMAKLNEREQAIKAEAFKEIAEVQDRKANLQSITYEVPA